MMAAPAILRPLAVSMGEPAGIGPDLILQLYAEHRGLRLSPFLVYGSLDLLRSRARRLRLGIDIVRATPESAVEAFDSALPVVNIADALPDTPGEINSASASAVIDAIKKAAEAVLAGHCRAIVTAPIQKSALYAAGFDHPGHTEYLAEICRTGTDSPVPVMMLAHEKYRTVPMTIHVPLRDVPRLVTRERIVETARIVARDLTGRFGIPSPKLAIAGLNPHAGEDGSIGTEDRDTIAPAVAELKAAGINAVGPLSADTLFHPPHWRRFDAVIAMYHDQALIPIKTLAFDGGVNVTLGLPIVRTSPDHGTALAFAGAGGASVKSMLAAVRLADHMSGDRT